MGKPVTRRGACYVPESDAYVEMPTIAASRVKTMSLVDMYIDEIKALYHRGLEIGAAKHDARIATVLAAIKREFGL